MRKVRKLGLLFLVLLALGCGKDTEYYMEEGNAYLRRRDMTNAIIMFERAVEADPDNYEAHNSLGALLSTIGDFKRAAEHFRAAVAVNDSFVEAHYNLGRALAEVGDYEDGLTELNKAIGLDSTYALAYLTAGDIFSVRKMSEQAADSYQRAIRFDPNLVVGYLRLSSLYVATGEYDSAVELLLRGREIRPRDTELVSMAGRVAIMKRDFEQAAQLLTEAVKLDSTNLLYRNDLATALMLAGREDEALAHWREILVRNPDPDLEQTVRRNLSRAESDTTP